MWTKRAFKAGELRIFPDATEIKDRYWTVGRSAFCWRGEEKHPDRKPVVIDGRLRANPDAQAVSIFFCVKRVDPEVETPNLVQSYAKLTCDLHVELENAGNPKDEVLHPDFVDTPFLVNPKKIDADVMLTVAHDWNVAKLAKEASEARKKAGLCCVCVCVCVCVHLT